MEEALDRLARFTEQQDELKSRVIGALAYPAILFVVGTMVVNVLVIFFVPKFEPLFARLRTRGELPAVTDWLLWFSHALQNYGAGDRGGAGDPGIVVARKKTADRRRPAVARSLAAAKCRS